MWPASFLASQHILSNLHEHLTIQFNILLFFKEVLKSKWEIETNSKEHWLCGDSQVR